MHDNTLNIKITAVAAELNYTLPKEIPMYQILFCAKQLVQDFEDIRHARNEEAREKLLN